MITQSHQTNWGCLAACIPADARRFRVHDQDLAEVLASDGAEVVAGGQEDADVEIAPGWSLGGLARCAVVCLDGHPGGAGGSRALRNAGRVAGHLRAQAQVAGARLALHRRGYRPALVVWWDQGHWFRVPGAGSSPRRPSRDKRFPQRAVVVGLRGQPALSVLDAALVQARQLTGLPLAASSALAGRGGLMVVMTDSGVLRVAVGPGRRRLRNHVDALEALWAARPAAEVHRRIPRLLALGTGELTDWSVEQRLPGKQPSRPLSPRLLDDCVGFLVGLHQSSAPGVGDRGLAQSQARVVARVCSPEQADRLQALSARVDAELEGLPRGFGHGDFWPENLLTDNNRLAGVIDWCTAGPARLPVLDLLNLHLSLSRRRGSLRWGPALVEQLLPWAKSGGDDLLRSYCQRAALELPPKRLLALVVAYWLDRVASRIDHYPGRIHRPWVRSNVDHVLPALLAEA